jgi:hypothetical protein
MRVPHGLRRRAQITKEWLTRAVRASSGFARRELPPPKTVTGAVPRSRAQARQAALRIGYDGRPLPVQAARRTESDGRPVPALVPALVPAPVRQHAQAVPALVQQHAQAQAPAHHRGRPCPSEGRPRMAAGVAS